MNIESIIISGIGCVILLGANMLIIQLIFSLKKKLLKRKEIPNRDVLEAYIESEGNIKHTKKV